MSGQIATQSEVLPKFLAPLGNHTVIQGREVSFTCIVNHLKDYRVAWIKSDSRAILAIHTHLVAHNPRISVTHNGHNTWKLHLSNVQKNDSGTYMCQVNTEPMLSQVYILCTLPIKKYQYFHVYYIIDGPREEKPWSKICWFKITNRGLKWIKIIQKSEKFWFIGYLLIR